jgi:hypothetical protein
MFKKLKERIPKSYLIVFYLSAGFGLFILLVGWFLGGTGAPPGSSANGLAANTIDAVVGAEGTPEYNRMIEEDNAIKADEARASGESFVPVPVGLKSSKSDSPLLREQPPEAAAAPKNAPQPNNLAPQPMARTAPPKESPTPREQQIETRNIEAELKGILARTTGLPVFIYTGITFDRPRETNITQNTEPKKHPDALNPGETLYAVTDYALNSDIPAPVIATILQGELKGGKAIGEFKLSGENVLVTFSRIVDKDGFEIKVNAFAVNPANSKASIRADVDTHFLERWGSLIAASFIEGFGDAVSDRGSKVYVTGDVVVEDNFGKSMEDVSYEALGKVGSRAATQVEKGFDRPPTVSVRAGEPIGILIISRD